MFLTNNTMQQCQLYNDIVRSVSLGKRSPRSQPPLDGATLEEAATRGCSLWI